MLIGVANQKVKDVIKYDVITLTEVCYNLTYKRNVKRTYFLITIYTVYEIYCIKSNWAHREHILYVLGGFDLVSFILGTTDMEICIYGPVTDMLIKRHLYIGLYIGTLPIYRQLADISAVYRPIYSGWYIGRYVDISADRENFYRLSPDNISAEYRPIFITVTP